MKKNERDLFQLALGLFRDQVGFVIELVRYSHAARQVEEAAARARAIEKQGWADVWATRRLEAEAASTSSTEDAA